MLNAIVIDDDPSVFSFLSREFTQLEEVSLSGYAGNLRDGRALVNSAKPDVIFLDVELPDGHGFELIDDSISSQVVFITAFEDYAIQAFDCAAVDYLLKPIDAKRLFKAVTRCLNGKNELGQRMELLKGNLNSARDDHQLALKMSYGYEIVSIPEIVHCEANSNYTKVFLESGEEFLSSKTLKEFEKLLNGYGFFRCHQSFLVNMKQVKGFKNFKSEIKLVSGKNVSLARSKQREFRSLLSGIKTV